MRWRSNVKVPREEAERGEGPTEAPGESAVGVVRQGVVLVFFFCRGGGSGSFGRRRGGRKRKPRFN